MQREKSGSFKFCWETVPKLLSCRTGTFGAAQERELWTAIVEAAVDTASERELWSKVTSTKNMRNESGRQAYRLTRSSLVGSRWTTTTWTWCELTARTSSDSPTANATSRLEWARRQKQLRSGTTNSPSPRCEPEPARRPVKYLTNRRYSLPPTAARRQSPTGLRCNCRAECPASSYELRIPSLRLPPKQVPMSCPRRTSSSRSGAVGSWSRRHGTASGCCRGDGCDGNGCHRVASATAATSRSTRSTCSRRSMTTLNCKAAKVIKN